MSQPQSDEMLSFDVYNNNSNQNSDEKVGGGRFEGHTVEVVLPESIPYNKTMTGLVQTHASPVSTQDMSNQNIISNGPYIQNSDSNIQTVPNTIAASNQSQALTVSVSQQQPHIPPPNDVDRIVQLTNDKLNIQADQPQENRPPPNAWTTRKSTQSVGISAVPSNNQQPLQTTAATSTPIESGLSNKIVLNSSNNNFISSNKPIVPKVDEQRAPTQNQTQEVNPVVLPNSSQPVEIQTVPVEVNQKFNQADFAPLGPKTKDNSGASGSDKSNENATWASLFNKNSGGSAVPLSANRQLDSQKKPVAKVLPYKDTISENSKNGPLLISSAVPQGSGVVSTMSYSAAYTQNLPPPSTQHLTNASKKVPPMKATVAPTTKPSAQSPANEYSIRLGGKI